MKEVLRNISNILESIDIVLMGLMIASIITVRKTEKEKKDLKKSK